MTAEPPSLESLLARWDRYITGVAACCARAWVLDPEEVRAAALLRLVRHFSRFDPTRPNASFPAWARIKVRAAALRLVQVRTRSPRTVRVVGAAPWANRSRPEPEFIDSTPDPAQRCPLELAADGEARGAVAAAVDRLPAEQRDAVRRWFWDGAPLTANGRAHLREGLAALREGLAHLNGERT